MHPGHVHMKHASSPSSSLFCMSLFRFDLFSAPVEVGAPSGQRSTKYCEKMAKKMVKRMAK